LNKLAIPLFLLSTACSFFCFAPSASAEGNETWWITPRYGLSTSTGMIGVELQIDNIALAAGILPPIVTGGCDAIDTYAIKYYFSRTGDSWSMGLFSMGLCTRINGISADYRWRWTQWDLSAGVGFGRDNTTTGVVPSFSAGYSF
jgi:hypothetical protein